MFKCNLFGLDICFKYHVITEHTYGIHMQGHAGVEAFYLLHDILQMNFICVIGQQ